MIARIEPPVDIRFEKALIKLNTELLYKTSFTRLMKDSNTKSLINQMSVA